MEHMRPAAWWAPASSTGIPTGCSLRLAHPERGRRGSAPAMAASGAPPAWRSSFPEQAGREPGAARQVLRAEHGVKGAQQVQEFRGGSASWDVARGTFTDRVGTEGAESQGGGGFSGAPESLS